eukprot:TRINITY_DN32647_c0_g1_i2.p1 TRINITY_DN32647_c0_g1~~TRINITY_DN32647_c0_g1_i2.p1  ORF type:complete len:991 (-),score=185.92 TRINITY_DN32647_c0_g1_i2:95-2998(-)
MREATTGSLSEPRESVGSAPLIRGISSTKKPRRCAFMSWLCGRVASSSLVSGVTALLTIYALLGDDLRLIFTDKSADEMFNNATLACMAVFALEVIVNTFGKTGYVCGFFFTLDVLSTITLIFDVTYVSEVLFGDVLTAVESASETGQPASSGGTVVDDDAARAARMSRAGTKAGRVVRLLRLVRLIRLVKFYNKSNNSHKYAADANNTEAGPGMDWEEEEEDHLHEESAVSKKLSEMTTRRVITLVLVIMLSLPFFQASMYNERLPSSAQYGVNVLYRRWRDDMNRYTPWTSQENRDAYLSSKGREVYVDDFYMYAYYHSPFTKQESIPASAVSSPLGSFSKLFFIGVSPGETSPMGQFFLPSFEGRGSNSSSQPYDPNVKWSGENWLYYQGNLTSDPVGLLYDPWPNATRCLKGYVKGKSLLDPQFPDLVCPEELRYNERSVIIPTAVTAEEYDELTFIFVFDRRTGSQLEAILNTAQTLFICFLLGFGAMTFSQDANRLVLTPIERMISKLDKIRNNPLEAMTIGDEEHHREQVQAFKKGQRDSGSSADAEGKRNCCRRACSRLLACIRRRGTAQNNTPEPMETVVLEKTIIKIGSLLALGFGEAGAEIIGQNMRGGDSSALNAMIPGRRVEAIFGFCDIRNFTDATEVLQDQVMVFVNRIAGVIHSCVNEFFGNPNKNIGDAFLLAWRLSGHSPKKQQKLADMSMISFIKIIAQINKSPLLAEYRNHPKLVKRLPNYRVRMGFGLHSGWAIEGAIGSEFKIDASYLSPNVNMAARLEGVTKQYGCLILMSDAIVKLMSEEVAEECRIIDHVRLSGTKDPFKLYTCDLNDLALEVDRSAATAAAGGGAGGTAQSKTNRFRQRQERQKLKAERWSDEYRIHSMFQSDPDVITMRTKFTSEFFCRFDMAYLNYEAGEWSVAKDMLEATRFLLATEDGPSAALLRFMKHYDWEAPAGWPGHRVLTEK